MLDDEHDYKVGPRRRTAFPEGPVRESWRPEQKEPSGTPGQRAERLRSADGKLPGRDVLCLSGSVRQLRKNR